ncbi:hypothetical protein QUA58_04660 [Microcoleus sp. N9_A1]
MQSGIKIASDRSVVVWRFSVGTRQCRVLANIADTAVLYPYKYIRIWTPQCRVHTNIDRLSTMEVLSANFTGWGCVKMKLAIG